MSRPFKTVATLLVAIVAVCAFEAPALASDLRSLDGEPRELETLRGRIAIVNFWATWCAPCLRELPMLDRVSQEYASSGVELVAVSVDDESMLDRIEELRDQLELEMPIWLGATTLDMRALGLGTELPATAILDRDGEVAQRIFGEVHEDDLRKRLDLTHAVASGDERAPVDADGSEEPAIPAAVHQPGDGCCPAEESTSAADGDDGHSHEDDHHRHDDHAHSHDDAHERHDDHDHAAHRHDDLGDADARARTHSPHDHHDHAHEHDHAHDHGRPDRSSASLVPS